MGSLKEYVAKRRFARTPEPGGKRATAGRERPERVYVTQKHRATALHYDFRLEDAGGDVEKAGRADPWASFWRSRQALPRA